MLRSTILIGVFAATSSYGVMGAFSGTTSNATSSFSVGTVAVSDNDTGTALYSLTNMVPEDPRSRCIKVTYTGTIGATIKLYRSTLSGTLGPYVTLTVTKGTGDNVTCADFVAGTSVYAGLLSAFPETLGTALSLTNAASSSTWSTSDAVTYRFTVEIVDDQAAVSRNTGSHTFTWEATQA